jgi:hypothetical protein
MSYFKRVDINFQFGKFLNWISRNDLFKALVKNDSRMNSRTFWKQELPHQNFRLDIFSLDLAHIETPFFYIVNVCHFVYSPVSKIFFAYELLIILKRSA